ATAAAPANPLNPVIAPTNTGPLTRPVPTVPGPAGPIPDVGAILAELRDCPRLYTDRPDEALARFTSLVDTLRSTWPMQDSSQRSAIVEAVVDMVFKVSGTTPHPAAVLAAIGPTLGETLDGEIAQQHVWPAAWSAGVLLRLTRERELPTAVTSKVNAA